MRGAKGVMREQVPHSTARVFPKAIQEKVCSDEFRRNQQRNGRARRLEEIQVTTLQPPHHRNHSLTPLPVQPFRHCVSPTAFRICGKNTPHGACPR